MDGAADLHSRAKHYIGIIISAGRRVLQYTIKIRTFTLPKDLSTTL